MNPSNSADSAAEASAENSRFHALTVADLLDDPSIAPGGGAFISVVNAFLPLVYGTALKLIPEQPYCAERISPVVFECFALKWRKLPKRTSVGAWLFTATAAVAKRERKLIDLGKPARGSSGADYHLFFRRLSQLKPKLRNPLLLRDVLQLPVEQVGALLSVKPVRAGKLADKARKILGKKLRKTSVAELPATLAQFKATVPEYLESDLIARCSRWTPKEPRSELATSTLAGWRWIAVRLFFKRVLATVGSIVVVLALLAATFAYLAHNGYLNSFFIAMGQRQMAKDSPEMVQPARPWPATETDRLHAATELPGNSADLYRRTNIWPIKLKFTREQWDGIRPSRVRPVRNMHQNGRLVLRNPNASRSGLAGSVGFEFNWTEGDLEFAGHKFNQVAVRYRGNGTYLQSLYGPKQSLKIDLNKHVKKQKIGDVDELNLVNAVPDFSYVRDSMSQFVFRELGVPGPRTAYAYVSVTVPGKWDDQALGLYVMVENIDKNFAEDRFGTKKVPIFKPVTYELFKDLGSNWNDYAEIYDLKTDATPEQLQRLIELAQLNTHASDEEFAAKLAEYVDIEEFAAFVAGHTILSSYDGFFTNGQNFYMYLHPDSNKVGFISWDQDHSWGEFAYVGTAEARENASIWEPWIYDFRFLKRSMKVAAFREAYQRHIEKAMETFFTKERLYPEIDRLANAVRPAVAAESDFRLERFEQSVSSEWLPGDRNSGPAEGPNAPVHQIKRFIENRIISLRDQLDGKSEGTKLRRGR